MTDARRYQLVELLEELKEEQIKELAKDYGLTEQEIKDMLSNDPDEVYDMDDGDCLLMDIDNLLYWLS